MIRELLAALVVCVAADAARAADPPTAAGLEIYFIDVDGGAATLIVTPEKESILIDSGWPGLEDRDPKRIVHVLKDVAGCKRLDHVVTTHWHMDHFGGVEGIAKLVEIGRFWDRGLPEDKIAGLDFPDGPKADDPLGVAYRRVSQGKRTALKVGDSLPLKGSLKSVVLSNGGKVIDEGGPINQPRNPACASAPADQPVDTSDNARSLSILFRLGPFDFLDCGDLTWNVEKKLVCPVNRIGQVDLFQVTHHGMDISNHPTLVKSIEPTVAIMDNGPKKGGSPKTVKLLKSVGSIQALYQLHKNSSNEPSANTEPALIANKDPKGGEFISAHVSPDGSRFAVRIGEKGEPREFPSR